MTKTFRLQIITPERAFFDAQAEMVVITAPDGEFGVLAGHAPVVVSMREGTIRILRDGAWPETWRTSKCRRPFAYRS